MSEGKTVIAPRRALSEIPLTQGKSTIVDEEDYNMYKDKPLHAVNYKGWWYAEVTLSNNKKQLLHRLILGAKRGEICDHINGDGLDNRRANLRIVTNSQNIMNSKKPAYIHGTSSKYKGVYWSQQKQRWGSHIRLNYKTTTIGFFDNEVDAALAYDKEAKRIYGEHARLNFPDEMEQLRVENAKLRVKLTKEEDNGLKLGKRWADSDMALRGVVARAEAAETHAKVAIALIDQVQENIRLTDCPERYTTPCIDCGEEKDCDRAQGISLCLEAKKVLGGGC